jgi:hypothetical protein
MDCEEVYYLKLKPWYYWVSGFFPIKFRIECFESGIFPSSGANGREAPILLGSSKRANLKNWAPPIIYGVVLNTVT